MTACGTGCCMWPSATYVHGTATVTTTDEPAETDSVVTDATPSVPPTRMVVIRYWCSQNLFFGSGDEYKFFGAKVIERSEFSVSFPIRFYPAWFTPALGVQHALPDAGLIVFADDYWPVHDVADDGRACCEAPETGLRHWHVELHPLNEKPARNAEFPPLTLEELDRVLWWN